jgi:RNA polymerase sigma-70 factor, ECF subfamily
MPNVNATQKLVELAKAGDPLAYDELFERVADRLLRFIRYRMSAHMRTKLDPVDALQEVYLLAHRGFARFESSGDEQAFTRWLYAIANNCLRNQASHFDAAKRKPLRPNAHGTGLFDRLRVSATGPATAFARQEALERLHSALEEIDETEREVIVLRYFQELTVSQISEVVGRSPATVKRNLVSASRKLGARLDG